MFRSSAALIAFGCAVVANFQHAASAHHVAILRNSSGTYTYTGNGAIISDRYVLTTASCIYGYDPQEIAIRAGTTSSSSGGTLVRLQSTHTYTPFSQSTFHYDISVLKLATPLTFGAEIASVRLPVRKLTLTLGARATISGWGSTSADCPTSSTLGMHNVTVTDACTSAFPNIDANLTLCVSVESSGGCSGGFGAPLVVDGTLVGLLTYEHTGSDSTVLADVSCFLDFLHGATGGAVENGVSITTYKYQAAVLVYDNDVYTYQCNGVIVGKKYVLTTASCVYGYASTQLHIRAGSSDCNSGGTLISVASVTYYAEFSEDNFEYNVAVLKLSEPLTLSGSIGIVDIPKQSVEITVNTRVVVTGWSSTSTRCQAEDVLSRVNVTVKDRSACANSYPSFSGLDLTICAVFSSTGSGCGGGIGAALVVDGVLAGLVTYQHEDQPFVIVDISQFIKFVSANTVDDDDDEDDAYSVEITDHNFQVAILLYSAGAYTYIGNGALVKDNFVVTTASCVQSFSSSQIYIRAGSSTCTTGGSLVSVSQITHNPKYDAVTLDYNIAVLKLSVRLAASVAVGLINRPSLGELLQVGGSYSVTGWGSTNVRCATPNRLKKVEVVTIAESNCEKDFPETYAGNRSLCGLFSNVDGGCACGEGAPLVYNRKIVGLLTFQAATKRTIFTRVSHHVEFINEATEEENEADEDEDDDDAEEVDHNYQVAVVFYSSDTAYSYLGNGAIVSRNYVLTTAYCVHRHSTEEISVRVGSTNCNKRGTVVSVRSKHEHQQYERETLRNDVAVLKLGWELSLSAKIGVVGLPVAGLAAVVGENALVSGWGGGASGCRRSEKLKGRRGATMRGRYCKEGYPRIGDEDRCTCAKLFVCEDTENGCRNGSRPMVFVTVAQYVDFINSVADTEEADDAKTTITGVLQAVSGLLTILLKLVQG